VQQWLSFEQERIMGGIGGPRFRRLTGRPELPGRLATGAEALALLDEHLRGRSWLVGDACTIADISVFGYGHVATDVGLEPGDQVLAWSERIRALPGFIADLEPYGENARPGAGRSIYD
jgi:glutathione S-transferase